MRATAGGTVRATSRSELYDARHLRRASSHGFTIKPELTGQYDFP